MYLPTKCVQVGPYTESFTWWIHGRLGRRIVQRVMPVYTSHKMELLCSPAENKIWDNTRAC
ncbi:hypothetical protein NP493_600g04007 [Ridgeia piscesae]|uniref:Uncharacterized protein n=1 Tax=Ridgeia piscesae TaxID=27915 RepID=A0AAD9KU85_RIDPI|nr:hypothetical protein NP493_600g04007 [Ridgeia piscesae]